MSKTGHFRIHGRHEVDLSAIVERQDPSADPEGTREAARPSQAPEGNQRLRIVNLSLGGACIEVVAPVSPGTPLVLEIVAPTLWDPLILRSRVVWSRGDRGTLQRAGLCFEPTNPARIFALFELLGAQRYDA